MKPSLRTLLLTVVLVLCFSHGQAMACPGCKNANETDSRRPRAYMYSILFMLAMPATVFTGFSIALYRLSKKANTQLPESPEGDV